MGEYICILVSHIVVALLGWQFRIGSTGYLLVLELNCPENCYLLYMAPRLIRGAICHHVATLRVKCGDSDNIGHSAQSRQCSISPQNASYSPYHGEDKAICKLHSLQMAWSSCFSSCDGRYFVGGSLAPFSQPRLVHVGLVVKLHLFHRRNCCITKLAKRDFDKHHAV